MSFRLKFKWYQMHLSVHVATKRKKKTKPFHMPSRSLLSIFAKCFSFFEIWKHNLLHPLLFLRVLKYFFLCGLRETTSVPLLLNRFREYSKKVVDWGTQAWRIDVENLSLVLIINSTPFLTQILNTKDEKRDRKTIMFTSLTQLRRNLEEEVMYNIMILKSSGTSSIGLVYVFLQKTIRKLFRKTFSHPPRRWV